MWERTNVQPLCQSEETEQWHNGTALSRCFKMPFQNKEIKWHGIRSWTGIDTHKLARWRWAWEHYRNEQARDKKCRHIHDIVPRIKHIRIRRWTRLGIQRVSNEFKIKRQSPNEEHKENGSNSLRDWRFYPIRYRKAIRDIYCSQKLNISSFKERVLLVSFTIHRDVQDKGDFVMYHNKSKCIWIYITK